MATMSNPGMGPDSESAANRTSRFRPQTSLAEELARAQSFTGANGAVLASLEGEALVWLGGVGEHQPKKMDRWALAGSFANLCLGRRTKPVKCDDTEADGRVDSAFRALQAKSLAIAPVHDADKVTGVVAVFSDNPKAFNGMHVAVLQTQADSMAELLQQARQAVGLQEEARKREEEEARKRLAEQAAPAVEAPPPAPAPAVTAAPAPPQKSPQEELAALESAFVVIPPPVTTPAPEAEHAAPPMQVVTLPPTLPGATLAPPEPALPKLTVVPTPAPAAAPASAGERPSLPGFMPLSATAAALAKAKPAPPTPPEMVVETKTPKPVAAPSKPAVKAKEPSAPAPPPAATAVPRVPTPAAPTSVPTPPPAPAPARKAAPKPAAPAVKFVPLAKSADTKTPPPGTLKPAVVPPAPSPAPAKSAAAKDDGSQPLPAAADPFAEFSPAYQRAQARAHAASAASRPTLTGLEGVGNQVPSRSLRKVSLALVAVAAVVLGGLWLRTRIHAAPAKPAPVAVTPVAVSPAPSTETSATPAPASPVASSPAPVTTGTVTVPVPASKPASNPEKPAPAAKSGQQAKADSQQAKSEPEAPAPKPAPSVTAPQNLAVKTPAPVTSPEVTAVLQPPPKTNLDISVSGADKLPDLPKAAPPVAVRQASTPVAAVLIQSVPPVYPAAAKAMHMQGTVRLSATVNAQGRITKVTWVSGNGFFKDSALSAVKQWRYKPAKLDGQAVESTVDIVLKFSPQ